MLVALAAFLNLVKDDGKRWQIQALVVFDRKGLAPDC